MKKLFLSLLFLVIPGLLFASPPTRTYTYTDGNVISATEVTTNEDNIYNYLSTGVDTYSPGTIKNVDIASDAAIGDTKLAQITTASKVHGTAITGLASLPSGAGIIPAANLTSGVWADYFATSTIVGWAASPTGTIYTKKIGKTVFVNYNITGTSNANETTFTVPYTIAAPRQDAVNITTDNTSTVTVGKHLIIDGGTTITLKSTVAGTGFTTSGTKTVTGQLFYESA